MDMERDIREKSTIKQVVRDGWAAEDICTVHDCGVSTGGNVECGEGKSLVGHMNERKYPWMKRQTPQSKTSQSGLGVLTLVLVLRREATFKCIHTTLQKILQSHTHTQLDWSIGIYSGHPRC